MYQTQTYYNHLTEGQVVPTKEMACRVELAKEIGEDWSHPQFYCLPEDITVNEGEVARFDVVVMSNPQSDVQWFFNGELVIPDGTRTMLLNAQMEDWHSLVILDCAETDAGRYKCVSQNRYGRKELFVNLRVIPDGGYQGEPHFTMLPSQSRVTQGNMFIIEGAVVGSPRPDIAWYHGDTALEPSDRLLISYDHTNSIRFTLKDLKNSDSGKYKCVASNSAGQVDFLIGMNIRDSITGPGANPMGECPPGFPMNEPGCPVFDLPLETTTVEEDDRIVLATRLYSGFPAHFKWTINGMPVKMDARHSLHEDGTNALLSISGATQADSGDYCCIATNEVGCQKLCATVSVLPPGRLGEDFAPCFISKPSDLDVLPDSLVRLDAKVIGRPVPNVKWYHNDVRLQTAPDLDIVSTIDGSYSLIIKPMQSKYRGTFKCQAENHAGQTTFSVSIAMTESTTDDKQDRNLRRPRFTMVPLDQIVEIGEPVCINGAVIGRGELEGNRPELLWFFNRTQISPDNPHYRFEYDDSQRFRLCIDKTGFSDSGVIQCGAKNDAGTDQFTVSIDVRGMGYRMQLESAAKNHPHDIRPYFVELPRDVVAGRVGGSIRFDARVIGFPAPTLRWCFADNSEIPLRGRINVESDDAGNSALVIPSMEERDIGTFKVVAFNRRGEASATVALTVAGSNRLMQAIDPSISVPFFTVRPDEDITVEEGEPMELRGTIVAEPLAEVSLMRGSTAATNFLVKYDHEGRLKVSSLAAAVGDTGTYTVFAKNTNGRASCTFSVTVLPHDITPEQVNDGKLPEVDKRKMRHSLVPVDEEQIWSTDAAPGFLQRPRDVRATIGSFVRFDSKLTGIPRPEVVWYHENKQLMNTDNIHFTVSEDASSLVIRSATYMEVGRYRCQAVNPAGETSFTVMLELQSVDVAMNDPTANMPLFSINPEDQIVDVGDPVKISTGITGAIASQITWLHNGIALPKDDTNVKLFFDDDHGVHMTIDVVQMEHAGIYQILAENNSGMAHVTLTLKVKNPSDDVSLAPIPASIHHLTVALAEPTHEDQAQGIRPPEFISIPEDVTCISGQTVRFDAQIVGRPLPSVEWFYGNDTAPLVNDGNRIPSSLPYGIHSLTIKSVEPYQLGWYRILLTSLAGQTSATFVLVESKGPVSPEPAVTVPRFTLEPQQDYTVQEGDQLTITAALIGDPIPQLVVSRNDFTRDNSSTFTFEIADDFAVTVKFLSASTADDGAYRILAINSHGSTTCSFTLTVISDEELEKNLRRSKPSFRRSIIRHKAASPALQMALGTSRSFLNYMDPSFDEVIEEKNPLSKFRKSKVWAATSSQLSGRRTSSRQHSTQDHPTSLPPRESSLQSVISSPNPNSSVNNAPPVPMEEQHPHKTDLSPLLKDVYETVFVEDYSSSRLESVSLVSSETIE